MARLGLRGIRKEPSVTESRKSGKKWFGRRNLILLLLILAGSVYFSRTCWLPEVGSYLNVGEALCRADCVLVLGGGNDTRPFVAAALLNKKWVAKALIPQSKKASEGESRLLPSEQEIIRRVLTARGVAAENIQVLPYECTSTRDEAVALAGYLDENPGQTVLVVTNNYHTRRARRVFRKVLAKRSQQVHFVAAPTDGFSATDWWRHEYGFRLYTLEYAKLLVSFLKD